MQILAIDPGPNTGFAQYHGGTGTAHNCWQEHLPSMSANNPHNALWNILETYSFDTLIVEKFEFRKDKQRDYIDYTGAELVGVCKLWAQQNPHVKLVMQGASLIGRTAFWSDDNQKVKQIGLYDPKAAPHGMDALRHVLYYVTFTLNDPSQLLRKLK